LLDHADRIGKKILISGGGRANFTNIHASAANFHSANPQFAKSALARYTPSDFLSLVERYKIPWHEKTLGQLFCDRSARDIVAMLEQECAHARVEILIGTHIREVSREGAFLVDTDRGVYSARALVVATGGLSIPKLGATPLGYRIAQYFGLSIQPCEVVAATAKQQFHEKLLFTHRGLSGPAVLQISSYWRPGEPIVIDLAPGGCWTSELRAKQARRERAGARAALRRLLAQRLADRWLELHPIVSWTNSGLDEAERMLHRWTVYPSGTEGYEKAEVTAGGVDTAELNARTMESRKVPGLYFIGEVVDVTGQLGGFNFQWAWASAAAAGRALAGRENH
jgi:predicted flavoprotein YhiN